MNTTAYLLRYLSGNPRSPLGFMPDSGRRSTFGQLYTPVKYPQEDYAEPPEEWKRSGMTFVKFADPEVYVLLRQDDETFTDSAIAADQADSVDYTINGQKFGGGLGQGSYIFALWANSNDWFTPEGQSVQNQQLLIGDSSPATFYLAQDQLGNWSSGQGDPPMDSKVAFGGGVPLIINGLAYGERNLYRNFPDSLTGAAQVPERGDPGEIFREFLTQRSNAGFPGQNISDLGKSIMAYDLYDNLIIGIQEDDTGNFTLDQLRDYLISLDCVSAISFDGSNSATLVKDDAVLVAPNYIKNRSIPVGIQIRSR